MAQGHHSNELQPVLSGADNFRPVAHVNGSRCCWTDEEVIETLRRKHRGADQVDRGYELLGQAFGGVRVGKTSRNASVIVRDTKMMPEELHARYKAAIPKLVQYRAASCSTNPGTSSQTSNHPPRGIKELCFILDIMGVPLPEDWFERVMGRSEAAGGIPCVPATAADIHAGVTNIGLTSVKSAKARPPSKWKKYTARVTDAAETLGFTLDMNNGDISTGEPSHENLVPSDCVIPVQLVPEPQNLSPASQCFHSVKQEPEFHSHSMVNTTNGPISFQKEAGTSQAPNVVALGQGLAENCLQPSGWHEDIVTPGMINAFRKMQKISEVNGRASLERAPDKQKTSAERQVFHRAKSGQMRKRPRAKLQPEVEHAPLQKSETAKAPSKALLAQEIRNMMALALAIQQDMDKVIQNGGIAQIAMEQHQPVLKAAMQLIHDIIQAP